MAFNIEDFKANINRHEGLSRTAHYEVMIPSVGGGINSEDLSMFASTLHLPGLSYQTNEFRYTGYGKMEKRPYMAMVTDAEMTFICPNDGTVQEFFQSWMKKVNAFNEANASGTSDLFDFPDNYVTDIDIKQYRNDGEQVINYKLYRAYPITMGDVTMSYEDKNVVVQLPMSFSFLNWTSDKLE